MCGCSFTIAWTDPFPLFPYNSGDEEPTAAPSFIDGFGSVSVLLSGSFLIVL